MEQRLTKSQEHSEPSPTSRWTSFQAEVSSLMQPGNPQGLSLTAFIKRELKQVQLSGYSEHEILAEAFLRGFNLIVKEGVEILYPRAWIRKTAYHYIQELRRQQGRYGRYEVSISEYSDVPDHDSQTALEQLALETDLAVLNRALREIAPEEQRLLKLNIFDGLSIPEIQQILSGEGHNVSSSALRKQKERAIKRLRQIYHSLRPLSSIELSE